ncbi:hypothetical protein GCM10010331_44500 [Streptomyces xanthochromogenes]|uniref:hypothetical protein n=1 Tax=Streptomyces xanthochromogenes TaxID=67384 RepID=UPI00167A1B32|nr:hypothetical protein [Streptomyces xanthochromogenes]GHB52041.1 hypothetical protein GCM10010331_44500 [Streptomyces xanthochromogenes]
MPRRYDDRGFVIVRDNSDRCRDCGGGDENICYQDYVPALMGASVFCLCKKCDTDREMDQSNAGT